MDLHSGLPLWRALHSAEASYSAAIGDLQCDVAVIGGGITGALVGHRLVHEGMDAVLLDKATPGEGSTAASTGLLQFEVDTHLADLIEEVGQDKAVHAYRRGLQAIDELEDLARDLGDDCGFSRRESLYFASSRFHLSRLRREFACRQEHGLPVEFLSRQQLMEISSIAAPAALLSRGDAQINPYRFTQKLLARAVQKGLRAFGESEATEIDDGERRVIITTPQAQIEAKAVVFATGYDAWKQLKSKFPGKLRCTYALASEPLPEFPGWPDGRLLWETARPYFYGRQTDDGRIVIGGADTRFYKDHRRDSLVLRRIAQLERRCRRLFPEIAFVTEFAWAGTFAETKDGLAYIGRIPGHTNVYAALGYGGNGITFSAIAARLICDLHLGRPNPDAAVFSFER